MFLKFGERWKIPFGILLVIFLYHLVTHFVVVFLLNPTGN
jgi:hypothetical protein